MGVLQAALTDAPRSATARAESAAQTTVLVVDDSPVDRCLVGNLLEKCLSLRAIYAASGSEALVLLEKDPPGVVLTDLQMQEMDGLELVELIRSKYPLVPVILMTAFGNEEIAVQALRRGATSYVPKRNFARDLVPTVERVLAAARVDRRRQRLLECLTDSDTQFILENDPAIIPILVGHFQEHLLRLGVCDPVTKTRVGIALEESLLNALYHGNLEISSELRQRDDNSFYQTALERRSALPYSERHLHVRAKFSRTEALFVVRDEGPGFDPTTLPDPTDPANFTKLSGRGLLLIRTFMDEISHNADGNQITMIKRSEGERAASP